MTQGSGIGRRARAARLLAAPALWLLLLLLTPGAGRTADSELIVAAAASLREPVEAVARLHEAHSGTAVRLSFGASSALAVQIRLGAPIDVFLSADSRLVDDLEARRLVSPTDRFAFASNRLVVVQRPGSTLEIDGAQDLLQPAIRRIALPAEAVPVGRYAREWLARHRLQAALADRIVATEHARATLAAVEHGHADVAIVYATDARIAQRAKVAYAIPASEQPEIVYAAAAVDRPGDSAPARAFLTDLGGERAAELLRAAGFAAPERGWQVQER